MSVLKYFGCAVVLLVSVAHGLENKTPCSHDITMGQFGGCVFAEAEKLHPELKGTNFSLEYLDPMPLNSFEVKNGKFIIKNKHTVMKGLSNTKIDDVSWDFNEKTAYLTMSGNMTLSADYKSFGKIMFFPVTSSGKLTVNIHDAKITVTYKFRKIVDESGVERLETYNYSSSQEYGLLEFNVDTGNKLVNGMINAILNYYWQTLAPIGCAKVAELINIQLEESVNKIFSLLTYDELINIV